MARQYVVTEEEMLSLIESMELQKLRDANICDPLIRELSAEDYRKLLPAIESLHRGFHMVAVRWVQSVGFSGLRNR